MSYSIKKILVPIDMSETSLNALETAVAFAKKHNAQLRLVNIVDPEMDVTFDESGFSFSNNRLNSADVLTALAGAIQHSQNLQLEVVQEEGTVSKLIIQCSLTYQADLVVMGTHGASGYRDGFIGSNTYAVMKHASCPVLSVPLKKKITGFRKAVFPIRPVSGALARYDVVSHFLSSLSTIDVLGLSYRNFERDTNVLDKIVGEIKPELELNKVKTNVVWGKGHAIADDVLDHAHESNCDLIVITSVLDVTTKSNFIGPHAQKIINCARVPVLNIKKSAVRSMAFL